MTKFQTWLGGLLAGQLLLAGGLFWSQQQPQQQNLQEALLSVKAEQLDRLVVSDGKQSITLTKSGDNWTIPDLKQLPADSGKLKGLLSKLEGQKTGWPVATTAGSHQRFEVADDKFQRRLQLYQGDKLLGELFIGTSPGFRKSHVRRPGDEAVYAVNLNSFEWPVKNEEWLDKALLAASDIDRINGPDYTLQKKDGGWHFTVEEQKQQGGENTAPQLNQEKALQVAAALTGLRIQSVPDKLPGADSKTVVLQASAPKGNWTYRFIQTGDQYYVSRDDREGMFSLSQFDFERIAGVDRSQLALNAADKAKEATAASKAADGKS